MAAKHRPHMCEWAIWVFLLPLRAGTISYVGSEQLNLLMKPLGRVVCSSL
jgi:hypothetical protein